MDIEEAHLQAKIDSTKAVNRFSTTVAVVRINDTSAELLQIGDSIILVITKDGQVQAPLGYEEHDAALLGKWRRLAEAGVENIWQALSNDSIKLREQANKSFGVLNSDKNVKNYIKKMILALQNVATILILTDGMYLPSSDPDAEPDWSLYVDLYRHGGIKYILETVRKMEDTDPKQIQFPRYKHHDDASAIAIDFE